MGLRTHLWAMALLVACGTGGDPGSGGDNLPNPGFAPYEIYQDEMGQSQSLLGEDTYGGPFARMEAGEVALYAHQCNDAGCGIVRAPSVDGLRFGTPVPVFSEAGDVRDPFLYPTVEGDVLYGVTQDQTQIVYQLIGGSADPQVLYTAEAGDTLQDPSVVTIQGETTVFALLTRGERRHLVRLQDQEPQVIEFPLCEEDETPCWARGDLHSAEVRALRTVHGQPTYRVLFSVEGAGGQRVWGFAQSDEGDTWSAFPFNPGVESSADLGSATQLRVGARYLVYGEAGRRSPRIIAAINDSGWPSMAWDPSPGPSTSAD